MELLWVLESNCWTVMAIKKIRVTKTIKKEKWNNENVEIRHQIPFYWRGGGGVNDIGENSIRVEVL